MTATRKILSAATALLLSGGATLYAASAQEITLWTLNFCASSGQRGDAEDRRRLRGGQSGLDGDDRHPRHRRAQDGAARRGRLRQGARHLLQLGRPRPRRRVCQGGPQPAARQILHRIRLDGRARCRRPRPSPTSTRAASTACPSRSRARRSTTTRTLFEQAGITEEPKTYDELLAAAEKLKAAGIPAITFGGTVNWHVMRLMDVLLETKCGAEKHDALMAMTADWTRKPCADRVLRRAGQVGEELHPVAVHGHRPGAGLQPVHRRPRGDDAGGRLAGAAARPRTPISTTTASSRSRPAPTASTASPSINYISTEEPEPGPRGEVPRLLHLDGRCSRRLLGQFSTTSINKNVEVREPAAARCRVAGDLQELSDTVYMNGDQAFPLDVTTEYFRVINEVASGNIEPADAAAALQTFIGNRALTSR